MCRNIMLTGCAGFIGSHMLEHLLRKGDRVLGVDCFAYSSDHKFVWATQQQYSVFDFVFESEDICSANLSALCEKYGIELIYNFAAETHVDNSIRDCKQFIHSNINGVRNLLEVCKARDIRLIQMSTDEVVVYPGQYAVEDMPLNPQNPYSATKAAAEHLINAYVNTFGVKALIIRMTNNFGPRQHDEKFIPTIVRSLLNGKRVPLYGDGKQKRDWLYVKEAVRLIDFAVTAAKQDFDLVNIAPSGSEFSLENIDLVKKICAILQKEPDESISYVEDRPGHDRWYGLHRGYIASLLNSYMEPGKTYSFEEGLAQTISYYLKKYRLKGKDEKTCNCAGTCGKH